MSKIFQVRYTVGDKNVAHEHYTEKGAKADAKTLSKVMGSAMLGEIDIAEDGTKELKKVIEYTGGEPGKAIPREGPPSDVEVIKNAEATKLPDVPVKEKVKAPKLTDAEKIQKKKEELLTMLKAIEDGTYVPPVKGRKPKAEGEEGAPKVKKAPKDDTDKLQKIMEHFQTTTDVAKILVGLGHNADSRRMRVAFGVIGNKGPILLSELVTKVNALASDEQIDAKQALTALNHVNYYFSKKNQPWTIIVKPHGEDDKRLNLASIKVEILDEDTSIEDEPEVSGEAAE
jgi:hypothetical protein